MSRMFSGLLVGTAIVVICGLAGGATTVIRADAPAPDSTIVSGTGGVWRVEFANHVVETVEFRRDGTAFVVEPLRSSAGKPAIKGNSTVILFDDDRTERWTPVGKRYVVEHWFPSSQLPVSTAVFGIADRIE